MLLALYMCLLWLSTSGLGTAQARDASATVSSRSTLRGLAPTNVDFAFKLYHHLAASNPKTVLISPVSISMGLATLSLSTQGHTQTQLLQVLGFNLTETPEAEIHQSFQHLNHLLKQSDTSLEMSMGTVMFFDQHLKPKDSFLRDIKRYYESEALTTNFKDWTQASSQINKYIESKTQGKIAHVFPDVESLDTLILVNYIIVKGTWEFPFSPENTTEEDFYVSEESTVRVPMMFQSGSIKYLRDSVIPCQLVQLNYVGNGTAFFILPDEGQMDTVIAALNRSTIERWAGLLTTRQVNLHIPKVSMSGTYDLGSVLADMDIEDVFTNQSNFSGITQDAPPKASKVVHKAMLQLDERGAQPAAIRGAPLNLTLELCTTNFNRPFIMLIFDDFTWSPLLMGKIMNPTQSM